MIKFVDINTGNVYDGCKPYIHWFDEKQSVGLNYDKQFIVITDTNDLTVSIDSDVFYLVDNNLIGYETDKNGNKINQEIFDKNYLDLSVIKTNKIYDNSQNVYDEYHIFSFNVVACGKYTGEVTDTITINDEQFLIGADFIDENDALSVNLINLGVELPNNIQRAIYEEPIDEQKNDYALLNRKYKELLNEYISIIANKGSYKSLINSLNWFEYGDLVKLHEYWKHSELNKNYLARRELTQYINTQIESILHTHSKTTYISINAALNKIKTENDDFVYEDKHENKQNAYYKLIDEPNPKLEDLSLLWSKEELSLKMTLLGNFFSTFFMPIHLDLIQSTVEKIVFSDTIKSIAFPKLERTDIMDEINTMTCKIDKLYHLSNVECWSFLSTKFGMEIDENGKMNEILGCTKKFVQATGEEQNKFLFQHYNGIGTIITFDCYLDNVRKNDVIQTGKIVIYHNGTKILRESYNVKPDEIKNNIAHICFDILLKEIGQYKIQIEFCKTGGIKYLKSFDFAIDEKTNTELSLYRLKPRYDNNLDFKIYQWLQSDDTQTVLPIDKVSQYVLDPVQNNNIVCQGVYSQFIATSTDAAATVHTNQVVIIKYKNNKNDETGVQFYKTGDETKTEVKSELDKNGYLFCKGLKDFIWVKTPRGIDLNTNASEAIIAEWTNSNYTYLIGINRNFTTNETEHYEFSIKDKNTTTKLWNREMFIPYLWKLEKFGETSIYDQINEKMTDEEIFKRRISSDTYEIKPTDVVCFLPDLEHIKRATEYNWKYTNISTNEEITPKYFRTFKDTNDKNFPNILQPFFGRYDFRLLPSSGYYDVTMKYRLDDNQQLDNEKTISSVFIVK